MTPMRCRSINFDRDVRISRKANQNKSNIVTGDDRPKPRLTIHITRDFAILHNLDDKIVIHVPISRVVDFELLRSEDGSPYLGMYPDEADPLTLFPDSPPKPKAA